MCSYGAAILVSICNEIPKKVAYVYVQEKLWLMSVNPCAIAEQM